MDAVTEKNTSVTEVANLFLIEMANPGKQIPISQIQVCPKTEYSIFCDA